MKKLIAVLLVGLFLLSGLSSTSAEIQHKVYPEEYNGQELQSMWQPEEYNGQPLLNFNDR